RYGQPRDKTIQLSKALSWLLRHAVEEQGLTFQPGGYVYVSDVLKHPSFQSYTLDDVHKCVETNEKKRFGLKTDEQGQEMIRAHQGHSIDAHVDLREITDPHEFPTVVHGTYLRHWPNIGQGGLSKMNRTHIHFAPGMPRDSGVISGMRSSAQVFITIDMEKAMNDGYKFYVSTNNVILCPGNSQGYLPSEYFKSTIDKNGKLV
ncbi:unnamed protein product, partial [Didymodactylos carnosus]